MTCVADPTARATDALPEISGDYSIKFIEPPPDTVEIWFVFINERGSVVMQYLTEPRAGESQGHTAILENGAWRVIDVPGSFWCGVSNLNAANRMALAYTLSEQDDANGIWHNAIYQRGSYISLPDHPSWQYGVQEINDHNLMTGLAFDPAVDIDADGRYHYHGLVLNPSLSLFKVFDVPGATQTIAFGINNAGWLVGFYKTTLPGRPHGFLSQLGDNSVVIDVPGAQGGTWPQAINNKGEIAGPYIEEDGTWLWKGFLLRDGKFSKFVLPNQQWNTIDWMVDNGDLSGNCLDPNGKPRAFVAKRILGRK